MVGDKNTCANLEGKYSAELKEFVENKLKEIEDNNSSLEQTFSKIFKEIFDYQSGLQKKLKEIYPEVNIDIDNLRILESEKLEASANDLKEWVRQNIEYIEDEWRELVNALGGKKYGSAPWKRHKSLHQETRTLEPKNVLNNEEKLEIVYEYIDILHFIMNLNIPIEKTIGSENFSKYIKDTISLQVIQFDKNTEYDNISLTFWDIVNSLRNIYNSFRIIFSELFRFTNILNYEINNKSLIYISNNELYKYKLYYDNIEKLTILYFTELYSVIKFGIMGGNFDYKDILKYYLYKNYENIKRWENGY